MTSCHIFSAYSLFCPLRLRSRPPIPGPPASFLDQRFTALESRYGRELQGLQQEKQQLQEVLDRQSHLVSQLQGEVDGSTANSTLLQRQQALLTNSVQQLLALVNHCNGKSLSPVEMDDFTSAI